MAIIMAMVAGNGDTSGTADGGTDNGTVTAASALAYYGTNGTTEQTTEYGIPIMGKYRAAGQGQQGGAQNCNLFGFHDLVPFA